MAIIYSSVIDPDTLGASNGAEVTSITVTGSGDTLTKATGADNGPDYLSNHQNGHGVLHYHDGVCGLKASSGSIYTAFGGTNRVFVTTYAEDWNTWFLFGRGDIAHNAAFIHAFNLGSPGPHARMHFAPSTGSKAVLGYFRDLATQNGIPCVMEEWWINGDLLGVAYTPVADYPSENGMDMNWGYFGGYGPATDLKLGKFNVYGGACTRQERADAVAALTTYYGLTVATYNPNITVKGAGAGNSTDWGFGSFDGMHSGFVLAWNAVAADRTDQVMSLMNFAVNGATLTDIVGYVKYRALPSLATHPNAKKILFIGSGQNQRVETSPVATWLETWNPLMASVVGAVVPPDDIIQRGVTWNPLTDYDSGSLSGLLADINDYFDSTYDPSVLAPCTWHYVKIHWLNGQIYADEPTEPVHPSDVGYGLEDTGAISTDPDHNGVQVDGFRAALIAAMPAEDGGDEGDTPVALTIDSAALNADGLTVVATLDGDDGGPVTPDSGVAGWLALVVNQYGKSEFRTVTAATRTADLQYTLTLAGPALDRRSKVFVGYATPYPTALTDNAGSVMGNQPLLQATGTSSIASDRYRDQGMAAPVEPIAGRVFAITPADNAELDEVPIVVNSTAACTLKVRDLEGNDIVVQLVQGDNFLRVRKVFSTGSTLNSAVLRGKV